MEFVWGRPEKLVDTGEEGDWSPKNLEKSCWGHERVQEVVLGHPVVTHAWFYRVGGHGQQKGRAVSLAPPNSVGEDDDECTLASDSCCHEKRILSHCVRSPKYSPINLYQTNAIKDLSQLHGLFSLSKAKFLLENVKRTDSLPKALFLRCRAAFTGSVLRSASVQTPWNRRDTLCSGLTVSDLSSEGNMPFPSCSWRILPSILDADV